VPSTPTRFTLPWARCQPINCTQPASVVVNDSMPSTPPTPSTTSATCTSACVSTQAVTGHVFSTMVMAIPSLQWVQRGGTHLPGGCGSPELLAQIRNRSPPDR
jgi:hypothetical protein